MLASETPRRALRTAAAARYLGVSVSLLRKWRPRGLADPGIAGPKFHRVGAQIVLYSIDELDKWLDQHRAADPRRSP